jgi:hypothetical protein
VTIQNSVLTDADALADLVADAQRMPAAMLPHPRRAEPRSHPRPSVDLTVFEVTIPASTASLVEGYGDYGS